MNVVVAALNYYECNTAISALEVAIDARQAQIESLLKMEPSTLSKAEKERLQSMDRDVRYFKALLRELIKTGALLRVVHEAR